MARQGEESKPGKGFLSAGLWQILGALLLVIGTIVIAAFSQEGALGGLVAFVVGGGLVWLGTAALRRGRRMRVPSAAAVTAEDKRPPVLYLRSFRDDAMAAKVPRFLPVVPVVRTEEEQMVQVMGEIGPVIAIGRPGEELPEVGAARLYVGDDEWHATIREMMSQARAVVFRAGDSEGFWWEIERAIQDVAPEKILILLPLDMKQYEAFRDKAKQFVPRPLPLPKRLKYVPGGGSLRGLLYFEPDWTPHLLELKQPSLMHYSITKPLVPTLKQTLRPFVEQLQVKWQQPPVSWQMVTLWALFFIMVLVITIGILSES